jgi:hypothetical protein
MDLRSYLRIYRNCLDKDICSDIINELELHNKWVQHVYHDAKTDSLSSINGDKELDVCIYDIKHKDIVVQSVYNCFNYYLRDLNMSFFSSFNAFSEIRYNRYKQDCIMSEHVDHIQSIFDGQNKGVPFMSALGILNTDYEGGELIFWQNQKLEVETGDIIVFPSNYLYPHKILPVKDGIRYSFVSWAF